MPRQHRYTGEWPPVAVLKQYPNWEYALDDEGVEGQDETTIRPETTQDRITEDTAFTAAEVTHADGTVLPGILSVAGCEVDALDVLLDDTTCWRVNKASGGWEPYVEDWMPESDRMPSVSLDDRAIFPLKVVSVLPSSVTGTKLEETIG